MKNVRIFGIVAAPLLLLIALTLTLRLFSDPSEAAVRPGKETPAPDNGYIPTPSRPADEATQKELVRVTSGQLQAIRKADWEGALKFSAPTFREATPPERFKQMIQANYGELTRSIRESCDAGLVTNNSAQIRVQLTLPDADRYAVIYALQRVDGNWRIIGCEPPTPILETPRATKSALPDGVGKLRSAK